MYCLLLRSFASLAYQAMIVRFTCRILLCFSFFEFELNGFIFEQTCLQKGGIFT